MLNKEDMHEDKENRIFKDGVEMLSVYDFIDKYHKGISQQAVRQACREDRIDSTRVFSRRLIKLTEKTLAYKPKVYHSRVDSISITDFIKKLHLNMTSEAVSLACKSGKIDYLIDNDIFYIKLTKKSLAYKERDKRYYSSSIGEDEDGIECISPVEFAKRYFKNLERSVIYRACNNGWLDYKKANGRRFIKLTEKTLAYRPIGSRYYFSALNPIMEDNIECIFVKVFIERYYKGLAAWVIRRACDKGYIDVAFISGKRLIKLTEKTLAYKPKSSCYDTNPGEPYMEDNIECISVRTFIEKYHKGLSKQAVILASNESRIDSAVFFSKRLIKLTEKTLAYKPTSDKSRGQAGNKRKKS